MKKLADETLPSGFSYEWTDLSYQQVTGGNAGLYVFPICVLFVFLVLAAQYGSWSLPFAVILIVPMCLLAATLGVRIMGQDVNILTQIGFVVLVGLAAKNAILIVEFARDIENEGKPRLEAVIEACRLRIRPILMTSFAFILGVLPLVISTGSGSEMRQAVGVAVFFGMLGVTLFGLIFTPVFYMVVRNWPTARRRRAPSAVGWAKALLRRAHHRYSAMRDLDSGGPRRRTRHSRPRRAFAGVDAPERSRPALCPPYASDVCAIPMRPRPGSFIAGRRRSMPNTAPRKLISRPSTQPAVIPR